MKRDAKKREIDPKQEPVSLKVIENKNNLKNKERKKVLVQSKIYGIDILDRKQFRNNANTSNNNESVKRSSSCIDI
jgi:hypothetical protein